MHDRSHPRDPPLHAERATPEDPVLGRALALVRFLRERCPWDARQDPRSLRPYLLEEAHEVADAIAAENDAQLAGELGDLLLNVAFQIVLAEERGAFEARDVVERLEAKMEARHPHVYGDAQAPPDWEALKALERAEGRGRPDGGGGQEERRGRDGQAAGRGRGEVEEADPHPFAGIPSGLEPLSRALRVLDRAGALGFEWPGAHGPLAKLEEETGELVELLGAAGGGSDRAHPVAADPDSVHPDPAHRDSDPTWVAIEEEVGDLLLAAVAVARAAGVHPSNALLAATDKFRRRFRAARRLAAERGARWEDASLDELVALWGEAKGEE